MLLDRLDKRAILWVVGLAVAGCLVLGLIISWERTGDQSNRDSRGLIEPLETDSKLIEVRKLSKRVPENEESKAKELASTVDLLEVCPEDSDELSAECMRLLDSHFLQKPSVHLALRWIDFPNAPTFASIFADPEGDRKRAFAALERSECRLEDGKELQPELRDSCDAGAIARFSILLEYCHSGVRESTSRGHLISRGFQRLKIRHILASDSDEELDSGLIQETRFERQWKSAKCKELGLIGGQSQLLDLSQVSVLNEIGRRFGFNRTDLDEKDYADVLISLADRLGAEESVSSIHRPLATYHSTGWDEHVLATRPWLGPWERMMFTFEREPAILASLDLILALRAVGAGFELDHLVEMLCNGDYGDQPSCQTAIDEIRQTIDWSEDQKLRVLDEFETRALELGLYD